MLSFPTVHLQGVSSMKKQLLVAAALIAFASSGMAQDKRTRITPDAVIWKDKAPIVSPPTASLTFHSGIFSRASKFLA